MRGALPAMPQGTCQDHKSPDLDILCPEDQRMSLKVVVRTVAAVDSTRLLHPAHHPAVTIPDAVVSP